MDLPYRITDQDWFLVRADGDRTLDFLDREKNLDLTNFQRVEVLALAMASYVLYLENRVRSSKIEQEILGLCRELKNEPWTWSTITRWPREKSEPEPIDPFLDILLELKPENIEFV